MPNLRDSIRSVVAEALNELRKDAIDVHAFALSHGIAEHGDGQQASWLSVYAGTEESSAGAVLNHNNFRMTYLHQHMRGGNPQAASRACGAAHGWVAHAGPVRCGACRAERSAPASTRATADIAASRVRLTTGNGHSPH